MGIPMMEGWVPKLWVSAIVTLSVSWLFLVCEDRPLASIGLRPGKRWGFEFLAGAAGGFLLMAAVALAAWSLGAFHWEKSPGGAAALGSGAWLFLAVAVREELQFRGYAFQRLMEGTGDWVALGLAGAYFAWAHWDNPGMTGSTRIWATLNIGLAGVLIGLGYLKTRSLALPMGLHLGWNWTQGSLLGFGVSGTSLGSLLKPVFHNRPQWLTGGTFGLEASLPCALVTALAIAALARWKPISPEVGP
jgi:uncharacterized protein